MLPDSTQQLILKLWDLTARGVIPWKTGDDDEHRFETEGYVVAIRGEPARVRILRPDGHTVEETNAAALSATGWPLPDLTRFDDAVSELANRAARISGGQQKAVRAVMSALSAPARNPAPLTRKPAMFGAIDSFDVSTKTALNGQANAEAAPDLVDKRQAGESERNVYSPWIIT